MLRYRYGSECRCFLIFTPAIRTRSYIQICQKSRRIGCVIPRCNLQCGITQPILQIFYISVQACAEKSPVLISTSQAQTGRTFSQLSSFFSLDPVFVQSCFNTIYLGGTYSKYFPSLIYTTLCHVSLDMTASDKPRASQAWLT